MKLRENQRPIQLKVSHARDFLRDLSATYPHDPSHMI